ncbi:hypothetical protein DFJ73DRAFT_757932 [Zopfochytrium polystomum]|nr:hypothetical protein DFJ73DRAFT_757932 [Zopfochytrium polystomum]
MAEEQQPFLAPAYRDDPAASDSIDQMQHCNHCGAPISAADKKHRPQVAAAAFTTTHHPHSVFALVFLGGALLVSRTAHRIHNELRELREVVGLGEPAFGAGMPGFGAKHDEVQPCHDAVDGDGDDDDDDTPPRRRSHLTTGTPLGGHPHPPGKPQVHATSTPVLKNHSPVSPMRSTGSSWSRPK